MNPLSSAPTSGADSANALLVGSFLAGGRPLAESRRCDATSHLAWRALTVPEFPGPTPEAASHGRQVAASASLSRDRVKVEQALRADVLLDRGGESELIPVPIRFGIFLPVRSSSKTFTSSYLNAKSVLLLAVMTSGSDSSSVGSASSGGLGLFGGLGLLGGLGLSGRLFALPALPVNGELGRRSQRFAGRGRLLADHPVPLDNDAEHATAVDLDVFVEASSFDRGLRVVELLAGHVGHRGLVARTASQHQNNTHNNRRAKHAHLRGPHTYRIPGEGGRPCRSRPSEIRQRSSRLRWSDRGHCSRAGLVADRWRSAARC